MTAPETLALYVHWPFCVSKCPYCDFNSHVRDRVDQARWAQALAREIAATAAETGPRRIASVFFGGGTPSLMAPATVAAVLEAAARGWGIPDDAEITLEANPNSAEAGRFADYRAAGVNRVSLGVQALDDAALRFLGRAHDSAEALSAIGAAARVFPRFSFDLIYARPDQAEPAWRDELAHALALAGDHLSVYQLTLEKGTPFYGAARRGAFALPDEDAQAALYEATQEVLGAAGLPAYEVSNHARPGGAESRHNLAYWRGEDYAGIGPGAHGRLTLGGTAHATANRRAPEAWLAAVERDETGREEHRAIPPDERIAELVMMGLRIAEGIDRARFLAQTGREIEEALNEDALARLAAGGFVVLDDTGLRATPAGRLRLNAVTAMLLG